MEKFAQELGSRSSMAYDSGPPKMWGRLPGGVSDRQPALHHPGKRKERKKLFPWQTHNAAGEWRDSLWE